MGWAHSHTPSHPTTAHYSPAHCLTTHPSPARTLTHSLTPHSLDSLTHSLLPSPSAHPGQQESARVFQCMALSHLLTRRLTGDVLPVMSYRELALGLTAGPGRASRFTLLQACSARTRTCHTLRNLMADLARAASIRAPTRKTAPIKTSRTTQARPAACSYTLCQHAASAANCVA